MRVSLRTDALAEHIARRNVSQNAFARRVGLSSAYLAQLLGGQRHPSGIGREKLLTATGLAFDDLFLIDHGGRSKE